MIDHVSIGVRDLEATARFYDAVLAVLGFTRLRTRADTVGYGKKYPEFWLNLRSGLAAGGDSGTHVCLRAAGPDIVAAFHRAALAAGGADDGAPGSRPEYSAGYFAAFIRDPEGNRIEAVTFVEGGRG